MREKIDAADHSTINRIRIVAALMAALVFGVALRGHMFSQEMLAVSPIFASPAFVYQLAVVSGNGEKTASAEDREQEGDIAPAAEESVAQVSSADNYVSAATTEENAGETAMRSTASPEVFKLAAEAYIVARGASGRDVAYEKNTHAQLPPASLTKLMTAVIIAEYADYNDSVTITARAVNAEGVAGSLRAGETFSVSDLLKVMLVVSSNDAAIAFEDHFSSQGLDFISLMNEKAKLLGMVDTHFANSTGLDDPEHYSSAADLATLAAYSLRYEYLWDILSETSASVRSLNKKITHTLLSNNEFLHKKRTDVRGGKTGYTKNAGGCMITVLKSGEIIVVLGSPERAGDTEKLIRIMNQES